MNFLDNCIKFRVNTKLKKKKIGLMTDFFFPKVYRFWFKSNRKLKKGLPNVARHRKGWTGDSANTSKAFLNPNASLKNKIASEKKTRVASTFCFKYLNQTPTSHFFQKENQRKFEDSLVFLTRQEKKNKRKTKKQTKNNEKEKMKKEKKKKTEEEKILEYEFSTETGKQYPFTKL